MARFAKFLNRLSEDRAKDLRGSVLGISYKPSLKNNSFEKGI